MKILFLLSRFPYPLSKGDSLRAFHQMRELSKHAEVMAFAVSDRKILSEEYEKLSFLQKIVVVPLPKMGIVGRLFASIFQKQPFQVAYFYAKQAQKALDIFIEKEKPDIIFCQLARMAKYCEKLPTQIKLLDYQDAFSAGLGRRIEKSPFYYRPLLQAEYQRMLAYEALIFSQFQIKTIISEPDRQLIHHPQKSEIHLLPNGVQFDVFQPNLEIGLEKKYDLLFVGNMAYPPNINCVEYIAKQALPLLKKDFPALTFAIAGINPSPQVKALASKNIIVTGFVPDMRDYYNCCRIFVAPMQIGIGLQNKLLEAMAMEMPCITSSLANKALGATPNLHLFVCDTPAEIAEKIAFLLQNPTVAKEMAKKARLFVIEKYSWEGQNQTLMNLIFTEINKN